MTALLAVLALAVGGPGTDADLPRALWETGAPAPAAAEGSRQGWWLGPRLGYIEPKDADDGTWLIGAQVRWHILDFLAVEGSVEVHEDEYGDGEVEVFTVPIQVTALLYLPLDGNFRPYGLAGIGMYHSRVHFDDTSVEEDDTSNDFGAHLGFGAELLLSPKISLDVDFRYIFMDEPSDVEDQEFDSWQVTFGLNFKLGN